MNLYMRGLTAITVSLGIMFGGAVDAGAVCAGATITNTGPGSQNEITCVDSSTVSVACINNINVVTNNDQTGTSGDASGSNVITGNATNENGAVVTIGASCEAQPVIPAATTPTPVVPPTEKSSPAGTTAPKQQIAVLPNTASTSFVKNALIATLALSALFVASRIAITVYRRIALR